MSPIITAIFMLGITGLVLGLLIGVVVKYFGVQSDQRLEAVEELLPGANCGACGFAGCADFARALVAGKASPGQCPVNSADSISKISGLLGVAAGGRVRQVAVVRCGGDSTKAKAAAGYNGVLDCKSATLVAGGAKGCLFGCLGLGSCARACPFHAIEMTPDGLAVVHPEVCTGCGKCVAVCPRRLIQLVPAAVPVHVFCSSPEKGAVCGKVCKVSCIGCRKCVKAAEGQMLIDGFLARVNYDNPPPVTVAACCPTGCLRPAQPASETPEAAPASSEVANA